MRHHPTWKTNLAICVALVTLVGGYFFYQVQNASKQFRKNSREHSKVLAAAVELNIRNAILSNEGLELIISDFLRNSANFISYLNVIEQFKSEELSAFAKESGLAGITIVRSGQEVVEGPPGWGPSGSCDNGGKLARDSTAHLYTLTYSTQEEQGADHDTDCVIVGLSARGVEQVQDDISVERLLARMSELPGISSVRLSPLSGGPDAIEESMATLSVSEGRQVSETHIRVGDQDLIVTQEASHFARRLRQMRTEFLLFVGFLIVFGALSSWWLYHSQRLRLQEARKYEQQMARQHEEASLGRAAATIAHEIRNPLNAIGMGLQRLQIEESGLSDEHDALLVSMREAVARSNGIVTSLQHYVRRFELDSGSIDIVVLINQVAELYSPAFEAQSIKIVLPEDGGYTITGDRQLLGQLFENLIKNAMEAQPDGGWCRASVEWTAGCCKIIVANGGYLLSKEESVNLFEPYYTSKTQGTGLGLAISRKIVEAHGGTIGATPDINKQQLSITIELPRLSQPGAEHRPGTSP